MPAYVFQDGQVLTADQLNDSFNAKAETDSPVLTGDVDLTGATSVETIADVTLFKDSGDETKIAKFSAASISGGSTRTYTLPNASVTLVGAENNQTISGEKTFTGTASMSGRPFNDANRVDVTASPTIDLTTTSNYVRVIGTTTINGLTIPNGATRTLVFQSSLTLTGSGTFIVPGGGSSFVVAANDVLVVRGEASGIVRTVSYHRALNDPVKTNQNSINSTSYKYYLPGGILVQGGISSPLTDDGSNKNIVFPTPFTVAPFIKISPIWDGVTGEAPYSAVISTVSTTGFSFTFTDPPGGGGDPVGGMYWEAVGQGTPV